MGKKELQLGMYETAQAVIDGLDLLYSGLLNNNARVIEQAALTLDPVEARSTELAELLIKELKTDPTLAPYASVPSHLTLIRDSLLRVGRNLYKRSKEDILLSDRAISELEYLFERVRDILVHTRDMILARNKLVARHIEEAEHAANRTASEYATRHEERLIEGLCLPKASALFLDMLDSFKETAAHANSVAQDLGK